MNAQELRELDAWIAEHVMVWKISPDGNWAEPACPNGYNYPSEFQPTTDLAAAMMVMEKCAERLCGDGLAVRKIHDSLFCVYRATEYDCDTDIKAAPTLPLAICLFAKELFK